MINVSLLLLFALLTLLLVTCLYAVITLPPKHAIRAEPLMVGPPAQPPPLRPASPLLPSPAAPAATAGQRDGSAGPAWEGDVRVPTLSPVPRPEVSGSPPWGPAPKPLGLEL
jgi:hypothetical protein